MANITLVSGILDAKKRVQDVIARAGKAVLNTQFPNDFEYYMCALELIDATDPTNVLEYFVFPIMPSSISIQNNKLQTEGRTAGGTYILENNTFSPVDINISGNFGRRLKTIATKSSTPNNDLPLSITNKKIGSVLKRAGVGDVKLPEFSLHVKTGYGATKILERIYDRSSHIENDAPVQLFFYNFAFNAHYLVQPINLSVNQSESENMIWNYQLSMKGVAPANEILPDDLYKSTLSKFLRQDQINKGVQSAIDFVKTQKTILQSQLLQSVGDSIHIDENLNKIPQLVKVVNLP